ncbi:MAG: hypothetical protein J1E85_10645 [Ruminococcus sp.]|nr:hypothetical protein [Ruminococcus sp.]
MPFNFDTMKKYELDYNILLQNLNDVVIHIFNDKQLQQYYCHRWIEELKYADNYLCNQIKNPNELKSLVNAINREPHFYKQKIIFNSLNNSTDVYIFFRISHLINILRKSEESKRDKNVQYLSLKYLNSKECKISWTYEDYDKNYVPSEEPIIICEFMDKYTSALVIDGNHRITYALNNNIENIKAYFVSPTTIIYNHILASKFEELIYILKNEISLLYNVKKTQNYDDKKLASLSFLSNGKYNFA